VTRVGPPKGYTEAIPLVPYGPGRDKLPALFSADVEYIERPLRVTIEATFDGMHRVHARVVAVERTDGTSVTPQDMAATELGAVMGSVVWAAVEHGPGRVAQGRSEDGPLNDQDLFTLARMYWFEFISWGKPRQAVMAAFALPRSTANYWIRKAREKYGLPGLHAEDEEAGNGQHQASS
jgi:hypothetical protein